MAKIWKEMGEDERKYFEQAAIDDKARYEREIAEAGGIENVVFKKSSPFKRRGKENEDGGEKKVAPKEVAKGTAPKRGLSAYLFFCADKRVVLKE